MPLTYSFLSNIVHLSLFVVLDELLQGLSHYYTSFRSSTLLTFKVTTYCQSSTSPTPSFYLVVPGV